MRRSEMQKLYTMTTETDPETGKEKRVATYIGKRYAVDGTFIRQRRTLWWLMLVAASIAFLVAGLVPATCQMQRYVLIPYVLCLLPLYFGASGLWRVCRFHDTIDEIQRQDGLVTLQIAALALVVLSLLWLVADVVYGIRLGFDVWPNADWCFLAMGGVSFAAGLILWLGCRKLTAKEWTPSV